MSHEILARLTEVLEERKQADPEHSYVASLYKKGLDTILKKVGEECTETVIAAKNVETQTDKNELIYEMADLWFHSIVLLSQQGVHPDEILNELDRRFGLSGIEEKAQRNK